MPGQQQGHYGPADLQWLVEHDGTVLLELDPSGGAEWDFTEKISAAGAGLGTLKNTYFKTEGAAQGTWKLARALLQRSDKGFLFLDLLRGSNVINQEPIAAAATTYTVTLNTALVSILEIRLNTSLQILREGLDYTVNYVTGAITFPIATPEAATIRYLASSRRLQQFIINGGFEDAITGIWTAVATATIVRNTANAYVEGNALGVTPAAAGDGVQYGVSMTLEPGRQYRLRFKAKAAAAETLQPFFNDGTSDIAMSPATLAALTTTYAAYEATFTATKATIPSLKIKDSKASPGLFYIDDVQLIDDTTGNNPTVGTNPMDGGLGVPFTFNLVARRLLDGVVVHKLMRCAVFKVANKSGAKYAEDISGEFLDYQSE